MRTCSLQRLPRPLPCRRPTQRRMLRADRRPATPLGDRVRAVARRRTAGPMSHCARRIGTMQLSYWTHTAGTRTRIVPSKPSSSLQRPPSKTRAGTFGTGLCVPAPPTLVAALPQVDSRLKSPPLCRACRAGTSAAPLRRVASASSLLRNFGNDPSPRQQVGVQPLRSKSCVKFRAVADSRPSCSTYWKGPEWKGG